MITTIMTAKDILREYKSDYTNYLYPRLSSLANRKTHTLKTTRVSLKESLKIKTVTGNVYEVQCNLKWNKRKGVSWSSISHLMTSDSRTGKKIAYIFSDTTILQLSASFLRELGVSVSEFLKNGATWDIMIGEDKESRYSTYINFGGNLGAGVGGWESDILVLRHIVKEWKTDPISDFLASRQQEEKEKSEVDLAWEAYFSGNLE